MSEINEGITQAVERYYTARVKEFGPTPRGVDWRDAPSQHNRFEVLMRVLEDREHISLLDFGCGYGALLDHPSIARNCVTYVGLDVSAEMVATAERLHQSCGVAHLGYVFEASDDICDRYDIIVASGIFNVKLEMPEVLWKKYVWDTIRLIANRSTEAFAYNCLTSRSDPAKRRDDLHYADHSEHIAFVQELGFEAEVADDYGLYEFTIFGRR